MAIRTDLVTVTKTTHPVEECDLCQRVAGTTLTSVLTTTDAARPAWKGTVTEGTEDHVAVTAVAPHEGTCALCRNKIHEYAPDEPLCVWCDPSIDTDD